MNEVRTKLTRETPIAESTELICDILKILKHAIRHAIKAR